MERIDYACTKFYRQNNPNKFSYLKLHINSRIRLILGFLFNEALLGFFGSRLFQVFYWSSLYRLKQCAGMTCTFSRLTAVHSKLCHLVNSIIFCALLLIDVKLLFQLSKISESSNINRFSNYLIKESYLSISFNISILSNYLFECLYLSLSKNIGVK